MAKALAKHFLDRLDQPRRAVGGHEHRIIEVSSLQIAQKIAAARGVLFGAGRQTQKDLRPALDDAPRSDYRFPRLPQVKPLGDAVDEQVQHLEFGQLAPGKRVIIRPQPLGEFTGRRPRQYAAPRLIGKRRVEVAHRQPARIHLHCQLLELLSPAADHLPDLAAKGLGRVAHLWHCEFNHAFGALHFPRSIPIAVAAFAGTMRVVVTSEFLCDLSFECLFDDQARGLAHQRACGGTAPSPFPFA